MQTQKTDLWIRGWGCGRRGWTHGEGSGETHTLPYARKTVNGDLLITQGAQAGLCGNLE